MNESQAWVAFAAGKAAAGGLPEDCAAFACELLELYRLQHLENPPVVVALDEDTCPTINVEFGACHLDDNDALRIVGEL